MNKILIKVLLLIMLLLSIVPNGCRSAAPVIIEKPIIIPGIKDTAILLRDTVIQKDSLWFGEVKDSIGREIGNLKIYFIKKLAELKINERRDTIYVKVPVAADDKPNSLLHLVNIGLEWWEKVILYGGIGIIISILIYSRANKGKI